MSERRDRLIHTLLGAGTLVWEDDFKMRFEVDGGPVLRFSWAMIGIGTPTITAGANGTSNWSAPRRNGTGPRSGRRTERFTRLEPMVRRR